MQAALRWGEFIGDAVGEFTQEVTRYDGTGPPRTYRKPIPRTKTCKIAGRVLSIPARKGTHVVIRRDRIYPPAHVGLPVGCPRCIPPVNQCVPVVRARDRSKH